MEFVFSGRRIMFSKELSDIDRFVIDFVEILNKCRIKYVIVSGYLAILFGRPRITEDIDVFIVNIDYSMFKKLFGAFVENDYEFLNSAKPEDLFYKYLSESLAIRAAKSKTVFPNVEIKLAKLKLDKMPLENPLMVVVNNKEIVLSPLELQIAFKLYLGSRKDVEDARFLFKLFENKVNTADIEKYAAELRCRSKLKFLGGSYEKRQR